jgi:hypothetical protein
VVVQEGPLGAVAATAVRRKPIYSNAEHSTPRNHPLRGIPQPETSRCGAI